MLNLTTDLALEAQEIRSNDNIPGLCSKEETHGAFTVSTVEVQGKEAAEMLCKPIGRYITLELGALLRREEHAFAEAASLFAQKLRELLPLSPSDSVLIVGLGNRAITPDALGPLSLEYTLVTRHLKQQVPEEFSEFRSVSAFLPGVSASTGVESADLIRAVCDEICPAAVIAVDALASRRRERLCSTVQLCSSGISPGSGVGNRRAELSRATLGVPVLAVGMPTVVYASTLAADFAADAGLSETQIEKSLAASSKEQDMIVTPRDIDRTVRDAAKLIGYGINLALQTHLQLNDLDLLLS